MGITACSDSNPLSDNKQVEKPIIKPAVKPEPGTACMMQLVPPSSILDLQFTITESDILVPPPGANVQGLDYTIQTSMSMLNNYTTALSLSANGQNTTPSGNIINPEYAAARRMPTSVTYSGGNTFYYTVDGQQKSHSLEPEWAQLLGELQQDFLAAKQAYENMPPLTGGTNPLLSKSDGQIKQMLEGQGFTVTILGNYRFKITKTIGDIETTQIFDANTWNMQIMSNSYMGNSDYQQYYTNGTYQPERIVQQ
ncbi:MAG TPA: hypothetical protein VK106_04760 [Balneolaceae bacterium]|nr:hypothetical protein [Balneolaceae bacterium]